MFLDRAPSEKHRCKSPIERLEDSVGTFGSVPSPVVVKYGKDRSEGSVLDKYQVTRLLGGSQQSGVYLARRKTRRGEESEGYWGKQGDDEVFLLKYLRINVLDEERRESVQDFFDQLDKVKKIRHQNIVKLHEYFERYGKVYMIMDYCTGENLASRLPYSEKNAVKLVCNILSAVKAVHNAGLLHQSINLENVMFADGNPKKLDIRLADFGLARKLDRRAVSCDEKNYACAPETFEGIFTEKSDIWSVGVLCYIILSRKTPFGGESMVEQIIRSRYSFEDPVWAKVSKDAKDFISSCLELNPCDRMTLEQAMKHRWFAPKLSQKLSLNASPIVSISEIERRLYDRAVSTANFKWRAINTIAEISSMEDIVNIAQWIFHDDAEKTGMTTYGQLKLCLLTNGYSVEEVDSIYAGCNTSLSDPLEFRDFLAAALEARGRFEEIILTETFERSFPDENSFISKYEVAGLLTSVGAPERVDDFFPERHWEDVDLVTFKDFLHAYHLKTKEFSGKLAVSSTFSITMVATVNSLTILPSDSLFPAVKYKKQAILGGSEVAAVYAVRVDSESSEDEDEQPGRGIFGFQRRQVKIKAGKDYAMKAFQGTTPGAEFKIRKELQALKELNHKNVVQVYDTFEDYGQIHVVMDLCKGDNLASRLPYTEHEAAKIISKLLSAVKYMHDLGIVHAALSLETVLFKSEDKNSEIKIVNFGLARKYLTRSSFNPEEEDESLYAASPESFRGIHTKKGDIWSIGVIAYYLLSGRKPFGGQHWQKKLQNAAFDFTSSSWQSVSGTAKNLVESMLQLDTQKRPDAAKALSCRWLGRNSILIRSFPRSTSNEEDSEAASCVRGEPFRRIAMNVMAQRLADEQIIELIQDCTESETIAGTQTMSYLDFKVMLLEEKYDYIVDEIDEKCEFFDEHEKFSASELLNATLAARGFVLQDFYRMELMDGGGGESMVSRACLSNMLERTGACIDVDSVFDEAGCGKDADEIAFEEFLRTFRELRTRVITSRLHSGMVSMTAFLSIAREITDDDSHDIVNCTGIKALGKSGSPDNHKREVSRQRRGSENTRQEWYMIAQSLAF